MKNSAPKDWNINLKLKDMKNIIISFTTICLLILTTNCNNKNSYKQLLAKNIAIEKQNKADSSLQTGWYYIVEKNTGFKRQLDKSPESYFIDPKPIVAKAHFDKVELYQTNDFTDQGGSGYALKIIIHWKYQQAWSDATANPKGKLLGFVVDNKLVFAPRVNARINGGISSVNRGDYTKEELETLKKKIAG
jgi:preprotein translocase subunit SecD